MLLIKTCTNVKVHHRTSAHMESIVHITPVLRELHWLPVRQRIDFKLAVLVYKALHGQLP